MAKIDLEKVLIALLDSPFNKQFDNKVKDALKEQGLEYKDGEIVEIQKLKFKVGDWVINRTDATIMQIVNNKDFYESIEIGGQRRTDTYNYVEWDFKLWTIKDAKDGDVLVASDESLFIFARTKDNAAYYHYSLWKNGSQEISDGKHAWEVAKDCHPAAKEQRDLLFQKMKEAGYEWDADKLELKKIRKPLYGRGDIIEYRGCPYFIEEVMTPKENIFYYNVVSLCFGETSRRISIGAEGEKDIILISNNRFDYEHANIQQKDFAPKASTANRQVYNRAILKILSNYVEKYPDIRFGQMLCNLDVNPHFDEESRETYCNLNKIINKKP